MLDWAETERNGNKIGTENNKFKIEIIFDRQGPRLITINCHLPYPPYFSLPFTCKAHERLPGKKNRGVINVKSLRPYTEAYFQIFSFVFRLIIAPL